jgi:hypothetical protein
MSFKAHVNEQDRDDRVRTLTDGAAAGARAACCRPAAC